jgi:hypothetical protein
MFTFSWLLIFFLLWLWTLVLPRRYFFFNISHGKMLTQEQSSKTKFRNEFRNPTTQELKERYVRQVGSRNGAAQQHPRSNQ